MLDFSIKITRLNYLIEYLNKISDDHAFDQSNDHQNNLV